MSRATTRRVSADEYRLLIRRVQESVRAVVPPDATVVVVSKGDANLLDFGARRAGHFPQTADGTYAGHHPADSAEAISRLEASRAAGAEYLVIPATSLWWLDHYADFGRHLDRHYRAVMRQDETCVIFALHDHPRPLGTDGIIR